MRASVSATSDFRAAQDIVDWMEAQRWTPAKTEFSKDEIERAIVQGLFSGAELAKLMAAVGEA